MKKILLCAAFLFMTNAVQGMAQENATLQFRITPPPGKKATIDVSIRGGTAKAFENGSTMGVPAGKNSVWGTVHAGGSEAYLHCPRDIIHKNFEAGKTYVLTLTPSKTPQENCHLTIQP